MERINQILAHPEYRECLGEIRHLEAGRRFCCHNMEHFLAVARLTYILAREAGIAADPEVIYAAALLHDIGRHLQYTERLPHQEGSARIAARILPACGFNHDEQDAILAVIRSHRAPQPPGTLSATFYRADKLSRNCFACPAREECDWPTDKKNHRITW